MKSTLASLGLFALGMTACSSSGPASPVKVDVARSSLARDMSPQLSAAELDTLAKSEAAFAIDIYKTVAKGAGDANVVLSPHSISIALGMTYAGARGETASEMKQALHFDLADDRLHQAFDYLDLALASRGQGATGKDGKPFRLNVTNSVWGQKGSAFQAPFLDTLATDYGAGLNLVDFIGDAGGARHTINAWTAERTENRIPEILSPAAVDASTRMVLVNAVYFNASWATKFDAGGTTPGPFTKLDGSTANVPMMHGDGSRGYSKGDGYEAVELPYDGNELSLLVIAPTTGSFATFESGLTGDKVLDIFAGLETKEVSLSLPKLKVEGAFTLKPALESLGMKRAFAGADFSGISTTEALEIDDVIHQTFLAVDEDGTEAAAATAVTVKATGMPVGLVTMNVDRPFITAIVDRATRTLVFVGRITTP